ncbi:MAG TPA: bifunctional diguanylate cyclase/phosphodiesterase [Mycobacteriales bacterium]|nr:bifunctional diguanylate cyclase/phosphodiesterase [Mycobacteriales bacterium]
MRWWTRLALFLAALIMIGAASMSRMSAIVCNTLMVAVLAVMMLRARKLDPQLRTTRTWMLAALLVGVLSGVVSGVWDVVSPAAEYPGPGEIVELFYIPCVLVALLKVPLAGGRLGFRARATADGMVAATSLLYLLEGLLDGVAGAQHGPAAATVALALPLGGVFVVSAALTAYARGRDEARPMLRWLCLGVTMMAVSDLVYAVAPETYPGARRALLQLGLVTLVGAATGRQRSARAMAHGAPRALALLPFVPFAGCVVLSSQLFLSGRGLDPTQLLLAVLVALALIGQQIVGNSDKNRVLAELAGREARLQRELRIDRLTGVANRLGLEEALTAALEQPDAPFALVVIDLDDFKIINDNHGHAFGDEVLRHVASRLGASVRADDVVARLGGDEFAVLLQGDAAAYVQVSERVVGALAVPVLVDDRAFRLSASVGLVGKQDGDTVARLLADADGAMYEAKSDRSTTSLVRLDPEGRQVVAWRSQVREQVAQPVLEQFEVHYQPVVDLTSGELQGMEALLRWNHPLLGAVPPDVFIPLAEQCGSIAVLGDFVLTTAVRDLAALATLAPDRALLVGINVSPRQLAQPDFACTVAAALEEAGVAPDQLIVEITEQAFEADLEPLQATVHRLMSDGVHVAVDDFGTGYSSLRYLQQLDVTLLKVDRSFVRDIGGDGHPERLLDGIVALAHRMDLQLVAEGIETAEQLALLRAFGCELGQGYLFSRPIPFAELAELIRTGRRYDVEPAPVPYPREEPKRFPSQRTA